MWLRPQDGRFKVVVAALARPVATPEANAVVDAALAYVDQLLAANKAELEALAVTVDEGRRGSRA